MLSKRDFISEDKILRVLGLIDDMSLMFTDRNIENISVEIKNLRVGLLQLLCLENLYAQEAKYEDVKVDT